MQDQNESYNQVISKESPLKEWLVDYVGEQHNPENDEVEDIVLNRILNAKSRGNEINTIKRVVYDQKEYFGLDNRTSKNYTIT